MKTPIPAYRGDGPYMFVCYAHKDSAIVFSDIEELNNNGVNIWYDEGIEAGSSWRGGIATAITGATKFLFFCFQELSCINPLPQRG